MHHVTDRDLPARSHRWEFILMLKSVRRLVSACSFTCVDSFCWALCEGVMRLGFCFLLTFETGIEMLEHDFS